MSDPRAGGRSSDSWRGCQDRLRNRGIGAFGRLLTCAAERLNQIFRVRDFRNHRSHGGLLDRLGIHHAPLALFLPSALAVFMVFGPRPPLRWPGDDPEFWLALGLLVGAWALLVLGMRWVGERWVFGLQMAWAFALGVGLFVFLDESNRQAEHVLYRHLLLILVPLVLVPVTIGAWGLARLLVRTYHGRYQQAYEAQLQRVDLLRGSGDEEVLITPLGALRSLVSALLYRFLVLLYLPAVLLVAVVPVGWPLWWVTGFATAIWLVLICLMELHPRLDAISLLLRRALFIGGQLVVSLVVIVLGIGRLLGVQYVSALVESSYGPALSLMVLCAYFFFWFYEYWINRLLGEELLNILRPGGLRKKTDPMGRVEHDLGPDVGPEDARGGVDPAGRAVQIHAGARFVAIGVRQEDRMEVFKLYEKGDLFERLAPEEEPEALPDLQNRIRFHFALLNIALISAIAVAGFTVFAGPQRPGFLLPDPEVEEAAHEETAAAPPVAGPPALSMPTSARVETAGGQEEEDDDRADLRGLLFGGEPGRHVLLLAASGGGTRAALYTIGVLGGLSEMGALPHLKLVSGVSGGSAALAFYAGRRDKLTAGDSSTWKQFRCTLDDPFIQDVLDASGEWRIFAQDRLGHLLAESFERRFRDADGELREVGTNLGVIFNTSIAGSQGPLECGEDEAFQDCAHRLRRLTRGVETGGRLVFSNLAGVDRLPGLDDLHPGRQRLGVKAVPDLSVPLSTAAALSANFPPVFSNAAVDFQSEKTRYWVTDGGAVENRGVLTLLLALRQASADYSQVGPASLLPRVHILVAEASGASTGYSKLPGLGSKFGAPGKIGSQLMKELLDQVQDEFEGLGGPEARELVDIHYLDMPGPLRVDGGLGTHWMLAGSVKLGEPAQCDPKLRGRTFNSPRVSGRAVRNVAYGLYLEDRAEVWSLTCPGEERLERPTAEAEMIQQILDQAPAEGCWPETYRDDWDRLRLELGIAQGADEGGELEYDDEF